MEGYTVLSQYGLEFIMNLAHKANLHRTTLPFGFVAHCGNELGMILCSQEVVGDHNIITQVSQVWLSLLLAPLRAHDYC